MEGLEALASSCPLLQSLDIGFVGTLTDDALSPIVTKCTNLVQLFLEGQQLLQGKFLRDLAANCKLLTTLILSKCGKITNENVKSFFTVVARYVAIHNTDSWIQ